MRPTIAFFTDPAQAQPRIRYVLDALEHHPHAPDHLQCLLNPATAPPDSVICRYGATGNAPENAVLIPAQRVFFVAQPTVRQSVVCNHYDFEGRSVYAVAPRSASPGQPFFAGGAFGFDWLETLFFHLSRLEEYAPAPHETDDIGMMKSSAQLLPRHNLHHIPVVDHLIAAILQALGFFTGAAPQRFFPVARCG